MDRTDHALTMQPQPRVFHYSLDWRFLLPLEDGQEFCLLTEEGDDFRQTLERVGIDRSQQLSLADLQQGNQHNLQSIVMPFGMPTNWVAGDLEAQVKFLSSARRLLGPQGRLLIGFNNTWAPSDKTRAKYQPSTPNRIQTQLKRAGFTFVQLYGAMPNLEIPEYIFALEARSIQFVLQNRFRRKPMALRAVHLLAATVGTGRLSTFLPCYFVVASV